MKTLTIMAALLSSTAVMAAQSPSQSQCQALWQQASGSQSQSNNQQLSQAQAAKYISSNNFKQVDTNNDGQISQSEFVEGCANGLVQQPPLSP